MTNIVEILALAALRADFGDLADPESQKHAMQHYRKQSTTFLQFLHGNITDEMARAGTSALAWSGVEEANMYDAYACFQAMIKAAMNEGEG